MTVGYGVASSCACTPATLPRCGLGWAPVCREVWSASVSPTPGAAVSTVAVLSLLVFAGAYVLIVTEWVHRAPPPSAAPA